jgi:opacity protein-like surface antigen
MKKVICLFLSFLPLIATAQFEQKVSLNFSVGGFKTLGRDHISREWYPLQMANYKTGIMASAGLQINLSRRFSAMISTAIMFTGGWFYQWGNYNYLHYSITDTLTDEIVAIGDNKLNFLNVSLGISPKYYLFPGKKWNPYVFAGIYMNYTHANYTNNIKKDAIRLGMLPPYANNPFLEKNTGLGFSPGIGIEYETSEKLCLSLTAGYSFILLQKNNFKQPELDEDFNAFFLQAGVRFSFLKSKKL